MHDLNDSALLAKCTKIKTMIQEASQTPEYQKYYYASRFHHWKLSPPAKLREIEKFEKRAGIRLPAEYVYYLTQVGRGGAGPGTGFSDFPKQIIYQPSTIAGISEQLSKVLNEDDWYTLYGKIGHANRREPGVICLCGMDETYEAYLIVTGPNRGRVVYLDYNGCCAPIWPKSSPDFLSWCENFFSELLAGYDIEPTWEFMWQEPGDDHALMRAFWNTEDKRYQEEVLCSFCKFKKLSKEAYDFLESIQEAELRDAAQKVLRHFSCCD